MDRQKEVFFKRAKGGASNRSRPGGKLIEFQHLSRRVWEDSETGGTSLVIPGR